MNVFRTAIEAEILFAARVMQVRFFGAVIKPVHPCTGLIARFAQQNALLLRTTDIRVGTEEKTPPEQNSSGKKIGAENAVLHFVFFIVIVNKMQQSAKKVRSNKNILFEVFPLTAILAGSGKTVPFEKRRSRYKETAENKAEAYRVYVEHLFSACDAVDARIFSKGETGLYYYGARYLDPKYSRWLSGDPALSDYIPKAPIDDEAKKHNENLPGMGGVFNVVNLHLYHYAGNNPVKYTDPDGMFNVWKDSQTGFSLWFDVATNPKNDSAKRVTDFMNDNPEFWGVLGVAGVLAGTGYGVYSLCPPVKSFVDDCCDWVNGDLYKAGFDILNASYTYNSNDTTKFNINFKGTSFSNLKTGVSFEKLLYAINNEKGNVFKFNMDVNVSKDRKKSNITFTISFLFNVTYREKNYEEIVPNLTF